MILVMYERRLHLIQLALKYSLTVFIIICYMLICILVLFFFFFFSSRRRHTRSKRDWSSDVCSSDLADLLERQPLKKIRDLEDKLAQARGTPELFANFRKSVARQTRGFRAPENCIRAIEAAVTLPFDAGLARERELFLELLHSPESKAQRYFFFAEREAAKIPDVPPDTPAKEIRKAAVLGAGTMGGGIAMNFANASIPVTVVVVAREPLERGLGVVRKNYEATASKGRLTLADVDRRLGLIHGTTDFGEIAGADIVVEAVFEV